MCSVRGAKALLFRALNKPTGSVVVSAAQSGEATSTMTAGHLLGLVRPVRPILETDQRPLGHRYLHGLGRALEFGGAAGRSGMARLTVPTDAQVVRLTALQPASGPSDMSVHFATVVGDTALWRHLFQLEAAIPRVHADSPAEEGGLRAARTGAAMTYEVVPK